MTSHDAAPKRRSLRRSLNGFARFSRRAIAFGCVAAVVGLAFLVGGFLRFTDQVDVFNHHKPLARADAIVVLTGGAHRIDKAMELLKGGYGQRLLISGVNPDTSAATLARMTGTERSLFNCCVDLDYAALDTVGNAEIARRWATRNGFDELILVTSDYHMPRSLREFERAGTLGAVRPYAVTREDMWYSQGIPSEQGLRVMATEYIKLVAARVADLVEAPYGSREGRQPVVADLDD